MKFIRVKIAFGLSVLAGSAVAADQGRNAAAPTAETAPGPVVRASAEPGLFPPVVKFNPALPDRNDPLWFSAPGNNGGVVPGLLPAPSPTPFSPVETVKVTTAATLPATPPVNPIQTLSNSPTKEATQANPPASNPIETVASAVVGGQTLQPLSMRLPLSWMQADTTPETWPPAGPRVGMVPLEPVLSVSNVLPITQPAIATPPAVQSQTSLVHSSTVGEPQGNDSQINQLPLPTGLRAQDVPQAMPAPQQPLPAPQPEPAKPNVTQQPVQPTQTIPQPEPMKATTQPAQQAPPTQTLPTPRTLDGGSPPANAPAIAPPTSAQPVCDLPVAPPELMVPPGNQPVGKRGDYNSEPIHLSHDFPTLSDVCGTSIRDRIKEGLVEDKPNLDRGYIEAEFLMWWMRGMSVPTLATTSASSMGTGFLGAPGTVPILGPGTFLGDARDGIRLRAGMWLDDCCNWGIDGSFFILGQRDADAALGSSQYSVITRPVYSPNPISGTGTIIGETGEAVSVPGALNGVLTVHAQSVLFGGDANLTSCLFRDCDSKAFLFAGYRNLDLIESLTINENIDVVGSGGSRIAITDPVGTMVHVQDRFGTANIFNGGQIGVGYERQLGRFDIDARASIAFGVTTQDLDISGFQTVSIPGQATQTFRGGLLAVGPNLGDFVHNQFSIVPELTLNLGYWVTPNLKFHVGYNFLYWTDVIRPGQQIDGVVNLTNVPNAPTVGASSLVRPQALFQQSDMLIHGVQFGVEYRW